MKAQGSVVDRPVSVKALLATAVLLVLVGLGGSVPAAASTVVAQVPGNTVVQDHQGDFILINADPGNPAKPSSLPPGAPLQSPLWTDIKTAKITQLGGGRVELSIALYAPVPEEPPFWVSYVWGFEGGCIDGGPGVTDKADISVWWDGEQWQAKWGVITSCSPRTIVLGDPVDFRFSDETVRVRVQLDDLLNTVGPDVVLPWDAAVRRLPFVHPVYLQTIPVDVAPDCIALNPTPPPLVITSEPPAIWVPRD
jgi:hypothetical protein